MVAPLVQVARLVLGHLCVGLRGSAAAVVVRREGEERGRIHYAGPTGGPSLRTLGLYLKGSAIDFLL